MRLPKRVGVSHFRRPSKFSYGIATAAALLLLAGAAGAAVVGWKISNSVELAKHAVAYQQTSPNATAKVLIAGDSTGVGTGASDPAHSVAGLLGKDHPAWTIENRAVNGAKYADVVAQIASAGTSYDAILIMAGGNDVIRSTDMILVDRQVDEVLDLAGQRSKNVIVQPSGNVGNATLFPWPFSLGMTKRSEELHAIIRKQTRAHGATYVNLFKDKNSDPFAQDPEHLNSSDGLHPSDAGYQIWYQELTAQVAPAIAKIR